LQTKNGPALTIRSLNLSKSSSMPKDSWVLIVSKYFFALFISVLSISPLILSSQLFGLLYNKFIYGYDLQYNGYSSVL